jgi:hypothetical protein
MTDYINNIAVDLDIYNNWPEPIKDCAAIFIPENDESAAQLAIINSTDGHPKGQITPADELPSNYHARILWRENGVDALVYGLEVKDSLQNLGIGKFLCILARTWVAENFGARIISPESFRAQNVENILKKIAVEYEEDSIMLQTQNGDYKSFGEIKNENI